jgi:hypothetical protein
MQDDFEDEEEESLLQVQPKRRLPIHIHSPVGSHGDALLELQVRYANDASVRQRIVAEATKPPAGKRRHSQTFKKKQECAHNFQTLARQAAARGDRDLAIQALEQLAQVEVEHTSSTSDDGHDHGPLFLFSIASAYAKLALVRLEKVPEKQAQVEQELQTKLKRRALVLKWIVSLPIVGGLAVSISNFYNDDIAIDVDGDNEFNAILLCAVYLLIVFVGYQSLRQRTAESKQLVQELFVIASNQQEQHPLTNNNLEAQMNS